MLLGGLLIHGLQPGPLLFAREPEFIYGLYGGLAVANISADPARHPDHDALPVAGQPAEALPVSPASMR